MPGISITSDAKVDFHLKLMSTSGTEVVLRLLPHTHTQENKENAFSDQDWLSDMSDSDHTTLPEETNPNLLKDFTMLAQCLSLFRSLTILWIIIQVFTSKTVVELPQMMSIMLLWPLVMELKVELLSGMSRTRGELIGV